MVQRTRTTAEATAAGLRLFVAGISWKVDEDQLRKDFAACGILEDLFLMRNPSSGESKGKAFLTFRDKAGADAALAMHNTEYIAVYFKY